MSLKTCTVLLATMATIVSAACPTRTTSTPPATTTCVEPPEWTSGYLDFDLYCKCDPYSANSPTFGFAPQGLVRCSTYCEPGNPTQREIHNDPEYLASFDACSKSCQGSFEKAKRQENGGGGDDYWFCHGVNFKQGELCEWVGPIGPKTFKDGSDCWWLPL